MKIFLTLCLEMVDLLLHKNKCDDVNECRVFRLPLIGIISL